MICLHLRDKRYGIKPVAPEMLATCIKCGKEYGCDINGKPTLRELLGDNYESYSFGDRTIIKLLDKK
jgi:hypothetical protein